MSARLRLILVLAGLVAVFGLSSDYFLSLVTLRTLLNQVPPLIVVSVAMTLVLVTGQIDLSVGSVLALAGGVFGVAVVDLNLAWPLAAFLAALAGLGVGSLSGLVVVRWTIPSFIVTLGMLEMARGGAYLVTDSQTRYVGSQISGLGAPLPGLGISPSVPAALGLVILGEIVIERTVFGRHIVAIGSNEEAVRLAGVRTRLVKWAVFAISGLLAGVAGVMQIAYLESADPNSGIGLELLAIAAVVIGGTSLMGGEGSVVNTLLGVLIIAVLQTGLAQIGASEPTKRLVTGAVIVLAVVADAYRHRAGDYDVFTRFFRRGPSPTPS